MKQAILILMYLVLTTNADTCSYSTLCSDHTMCQYEVRNALLDFVLRVVMIASLKKKDVDSYVIIRKTRLRK